MNCIKGDACDRVPQFDVSSWLQGYMLSLSDTSRLPYVRTFTPWPPGRRIDATFTMAALRCKLDCVCNGERAAGSCPSGACSRC